MNSLLFVISSLLISTSLAESNHECSCSELTYQKDCEYQAATGRKHCVWASNSCRDFECKDYTTIGECTSVQYLGPYSRYTTCLWTGTACVDIYRCDRPYRRSLRESDYCNYQTISCTGLVEDSCKSRYLLSACMWEAGACKATVQKACSDLTTAECIFGSCEVNKESKCVEVDDTAACADRTFENWCERDRYCLWETDKCREKTCKDANCSGPMITIVHGNMKFCKLSGTCVDAVADDIKDICYEWSDYDDYRWDGSGCSQCGEKYSEDSFGVNVFALITLLLLGLMI